jgi:NHL repeat-containing protein
VTCTAPSATSMCLPVGVAVDGRDRLYVADSSNNRVLRFDEPRRNGQAADLVLGQADFGSVSQGCVPGTIGASRLCLPFAIAIRGGKVYVSDTGNNRLLRYARPRANGQPADLVLGQPDFASKNCNAGAAAGPSAQTLCAPSGLAINPRGDVYVADAVNNRVLGYEQPASNNQSARLVLGQPDFTSSLRHCTAGAVSARTLCDPFGLAVGAQGELFVADRLASRVLRYDSPESNQPAPDLIVGQPDGASTGCNDDGVSARTLCGPAGVTVRHGRLYVADTGNNRVLRYSPAGLQGSGEDPAETSTTSQPADGR